MWWLIFSSGGETSSDYLSLSYYHATLIAKSRKNSNLEIINRDHLHNKNVIIVKILWSHQLAYILIEIFNLKNFIDSLIC